MEKDYARAIEAHRLLSSLLSLYQIDKPFVSVIKEALSLRGIKVSTNMIAPARELSEEKRTSKTNTRSSIRDRKKFYQLLIKSVFQETYIL